MILNQVKSYIRENLPKVFREQGCSGFLIRLLENEKLFAIALMSKRKTIKVTDSLENEEKQ